MLRINDVPLGDHGRRRVEVSWQDGPARQVAVSTFTYQVAEADAEKVRWYLEDFAEFPADPAPRLALEAESVLADTGAGLFRLVFSGQDALGIWGRVGAGLGQVRVEVDTDPAEVPGLPWELVRDPGTGTALALGAGEFVRTHLQATARASLPEAGGKTLRVLLVICRPGRGDDVPFRSVASRLARGGAAQMPGLDLDVLRPATFARLAEVLRQAADAGRPYHVVHFDGHGDYLDLADLQPGQDDDNGAAAGTSGRGGGGVGLSPLRYGISVAGPVRAGQHGYLIFEDPASPTNQQLTDGPALGRLLTATGVPVLVLNACRSAYTEALPHPGEPEPGPGDTGNRPTATGDGAGGEAAGLAADVHSRIRAYGSLAAEVADAGVPGVVAMRYNVYVVTAAQFVADLYIYLLAGRSLGEAATAARRALADNPTRQIGGIPVALQDWVVPIVYEADPLTLLRPGTHEVPLVQLTSADGGSGTAGGGLPRPPDAGFFGRDETLLALDRAFDTQPVVLLEAFAGAGKSATAAEFARWYQATGGLDDPGHADWGAGPVLWSSFEHHLPLDRLIGAAGDAFAPLLEANGIPWQTITDPAQRHSQVLQVLAQVPALWVWDNTEPVTGFPPGTPSAWTPAEQDDLVNFLRDLAQQTRCKVLLTSRRGEHAWLGGLPARLQLPPMPKRERLELAAAIAARHGHPNSDTDWRPLLNYTAGNPDFIDPETGGPLPGRDDQWTIITEYRVRLATAARAWPIAARLQHAQIAWTRDQAATAQATPDGQLTFAQRHQLRSLAVSLQLLGDILRWQEDPGCLPYYEEALGLYRRIGARGEEANLALTLGNAYMDVPGLRDLDQAERWYRHSLGHRAEHDRVGRAKTLWGLGILAYRQFLEARAADAAEPVLVEHRNAALAAYKQALELIPTGDAENLAGVHNQLGNIYLQAGDTRQALHHYQQSIAHQEARGNTYGAGLTRYNIAVLLQRAGRPGDALHYARAALHDFERTGPGATQRAATARELVARLEQDNG